MNVLALTLLALSGPAHGSIFATTLPLDALRMLVHEASTVDNPDDEKVVMLNDVARAFFEADATRDICVEIPAEARDAKDDEDDNVALLEKSLYGTRDAAQNFQ